MPKRGATEWMPPTPTGPVFTALTPGPAKPGPCIGPVTLPDGPAPEGRSRSLPVPRASAFRLPARASSSPVTAERRGVLPSPRRRRSVLATHIRRCCAEGDHAHDQSEPGQVDLHEISLPSWQRRLQVEARSRSPSFMAGRRRRLQSRIKLITAGTTTSSRIGPTSMPPTTTVASGR